MMPGLGEQPSFRRLFTQTERDGLVFLQRQKGEDRDSICVKLV